MDPIWWMSNWFEMARDEGLRAGIREGGITLLYAYYHNAPWIHEQQLYDEEWDVAIILDACRPDTLAEVSCQFEFLSTVNHSTAYSPASWTGEWMSQTFSEEHNEKIKETIYITANPFSTQYINREQFAVLNEVWRDGWDKESGTVLPETITNHAITAARNNEYEHLAIHYMQPHFPSPPRPLSTGVDLGPNFEDHLSKTELKTVWEAIQEGDISLREAKKSYRENLKYVLKEVERLLQNLEADRVLITADHGQAFGEWGVLGHPNVPIPAIRCVPWIRTSSRDNHTSHPTVAREKNTPSDNIKERLQSLGYRT